MNLLAVLRNSIIFLVGALVAFILTMIYSSDIMSTAIYKDIASSSASLENKTMVKTGVVAIIVVATLIFLAALIAIPILFE